MRPLIGFVYTKQRDNKNACNKNSGLQRGKFDKLENSLLNIYLAWGGIRQEELSEVLRHCYRTATGKARPRTEGLKAKFML